MIKFATSFARSGFGLGVAIGLMVTIHLNSLVQAMPMMAADTSCDTILDVPPEVQAWIDLQCQVNEALFADGLEPSTTYAIDTAVEHPGTYFGMTYDGRAVSLEAIMVIEADLENEAPWLIEEGVSSHLVIGMLSGHAGDVRIAGAVMLTGTLTPDDEFLLLIFDILTEEEYAVFVAAAQIMAGVQTLDLNTFIYEPLSSSNIDGAAWVFGNNPSTLLHQTQAGGAAAEVDIACANLAFERYRNTVNDAMEDLATCMARAKEFFLICVAACGVGLLIPLFGWIGAGVCVGTCGLNADRMFKNCNEDFYDVLWRAMRDLNLDLQGCGVVIV